MVGYPFLTSAPGKVIIFGEHSVVYNKPAIAAALSLRTYLLVSENDKKDHVTLQFPDIGFSHSWHLNDFPWHLVRKTSTAMDADSESGSRPATTEELIPEIVDHLTNDMLSQLSSSLHYSAALCFLYLYVNLCNEKTQGLVFTVRSTLPIGAGLGSSASISVCLATALSWVGGHIERPKFALNEPPHGKESPDCHFIDSWSFMGEKCIHGTPSGIDNACATHGGAVMFKRNDDTSMPNVRTSMRNFPSLDLLLTNTKVPRRTADLVGNVSRLNQEYPPIISGILNSMERVAKEAYSIMLKPIDDEAKGKLQELIKINQGLLCALGVSHPALDKIKLITDANNIGMTKLTGAGGGGCAITLLNSNVDRAVLEQTVRNFVDEGFETFETKLGGKGCGLLIPEGSEQVSFLTAENLLSLTSRQEIESTIGTEKLDNWRFW